MLDQVSLKNLQPVDMPKRRIARRLVSMVIVFCGMLMALESIFGGQVTSGHFRADEANHLKAHQYPNVKSMLAAGKIAHEFGHVNRAFTDDKFQRQNQLVFANTPILVGRHDIRDARLTELEQQPGATAVEIWADRECSAEATALLYLREKAGKGFVARSLITRIAKNIELNAKHCARCFVPELLLPIMTVKR